MLTKLIFPFVLCNLVMYSQVGINNETPKTMLDVQKSNSLSGIADGVLVSRMTGDELINKDGLYGQDQNSALVFVTTPSASPTGKTSNVITSGFYYYNSPTSKWLPLSMPKFFYMPSIYFETSTLSTNNTKDLYQLYLTQFNNPQVKSTGSSGKIPVLGKNELEYYVTYYDSSVFANMTIDENGLLKYDVVSNANDYTFMNIVFVVK